jgi:uncharacterized protein (TIGR02996 family)
VPDNEHRKQFEALLRENPYDAGTHFVYADWLEENGFDDESAWQRSWTPERQRAEDWLRDFAQKCGQTCENYAEGSNRYWKAYDKWKESGRKGPEPKYSDFSVSERWREITYEDVVQAGHDYTDKEDYWVQMGSETARDLMSDEAVRTEYWRCWELVTGRKFKQNEEDPWDRTSPFSCSC